jgi:hypothetical protein
MAPSRHVVSRIMAEKFALIIHNSHYEDSRLGRLTAPDVDVRELESVLRSPDIGQFSEVMTLRDESCAVVRKAVARFYDQRKRDDLLFLYFSGHGVKDEQGHLYLALRDTAVGLLAETAIETSFISARMDRSFSKRQVLVLDCCHSGAFAHGTKSARGMSVGTAEAFEGTGLGRVILAATDATQYAWDGDSVEGEAQNSMFTHYLIEGLKSGAADQDSDGVVTIDELYDYVRDRVTSTTPRQTPYKWSYRQQGDIVLAQNPFVKSGTLRPEIRDAIASTSSDVRLDGVRGLQALLRGQDVGQSRAALAALKELTQDDSRKVAHAAIEAMKAHEEGRADRPPPLRTIRGDRPPAGPPETSVEDRPESRPTDVFISYAREDQETAKALAKVLGAVGWKIWWDRKIAPGESFDKVIEQNLKTCKCAIVLWSKHSVEATWVRNEARRAARRRVLVPILIDAVESPLEFEDLQAVDLISWKAPADHPEFEALFNRIGELVPSSPLHLHQDAQFTAYRPKALVPGTWSVMLVFAHLAKPVHADEPNPVEEVRRQAASILQEAEQDFQVSISDSRDAVPHESELRLVPFVNGVEFDPPERRFKWVQSVHREEFRLRASNIAPPRVVRGRLTVFLGGVILAEISLVFEVVLQIRQPQPRLEVEARRFRRIFASYSRRDEEIVKQFEQCFRACGDDYWRDVAELRTGQNWKRRVFELIDGADMFQLFWSWNALESDSVRLEYKHALALNRDFIRPVFWEHPLPQRDGLPPARLLSLHFHRIEIPNLDSRQSSSIPPPVPIAPIESHLGDGFIRSTRRVLGDRVASKRLVAAGLALAFAATLLFLSAWCSA